MIGRGRGVNVGRGRGGNGDPPPNAIIGINYVIDGGNVNSISIGHES